MRLEWLEDILAVAETGSFSEAAERRHLTQSAFSRRIRQIEEHVGVELFDRTHKPVHLRPTTASRHVEIARLAADLRRLAVDLRMGARSADRIVITTQHALSAGYAPAVLAALQAARPGLYPRLRSANLDACFSQLLAREADVAIVYRLPGEDHPVRRDFVVSLDLGTDWMIPVTGAAHVASVEHGLQRGALACVAYPHEVFMGQVMERALLPQMPAGVVATPRAETALTLAALEMAAQGLAVAWVPRSLAKAGLADGRLADLSQVLPICALQVSAVRLAGPGGGVCGEVWDFLAHLSPGDGPLGAPAMSGEIGPDIPQ